VGMGSVGNRRSIVVLALVAGVVATVVAWQFLGGGQQGQSRAGSGGPGSAEVVRTIGLVERGTPAAEALERGLLEVAVVGGEELPPVPVGSTGELAGLVAAIDIPPGTTVATGMFAAAGSLDGGLADRLPRPGLTAVAVTLDATRAVGGWLQPGDRVNLLVPSVCPDEGVLTQQAAEAGLEWKCRTMRHLFQAVEVLAVGAAAIPMPGGLPVDTIPEPQMGAVTVVMAVPPRAAQWVTSYDTELWLTLVDRAWRPRPVDRLPPTFERFPGEEPGQLTPYCPDPSAPPLPDEIPDDCPEPGGDT